MGPVITINNDYIRIISYGQTMRDTPGLPPVEEKRI